ncbi:15537_t:CDS:2, partial [Funneliformis mosseae]
MDAVSGQTYPTGEAIEEELAYFDDPAPQSVKKMNREAISQSGGETNE